MTAVHCRPQYIVGGIYVWRHYLTFSSFTSKPVVKLPTDTRMFYKFGILERQPIIVYEDGRIARYKIALPLKPTLETIYVSKATGSVSGHYRKRHYSAVEPGSLIVNPLTFVLTDYAGNS